MLTTFVRDKLQPALGGNSLIVCGQLHRRIDGIMQIGKHRVQVDGSLKVFLIELVGIDTEIRRNCCHVGF